MDWFDNMFISSVVCSCHYDSDSELKLMKVGTIAPKKFIARLRKEKVEFDNYMQQVSLVLDHKREAKTKTDLIV